MINPDDLLAEYLAGHTTRAHRKRKLREDLRRRLEVNQGDPLGVLKEVHGFLMERPELDIVAVYSALPGEVDLSSLVAGLDRIWVFPKVVGEELVFHEVRNIRKDLVVGKFNVLEPKKWLPVIDVGEIDLFLCPGLGFDHTGARIGRGRGFYDRVLARAREDAVKVGVCFGFQFVEKVDMEEHDIRMNQVIAG